MPSHALFLYPWSQSFCVEQGASRNPVCKWVFLHTSQTTASQQRSGLICAYKDLCFRSRACAGLKDFICWAQDCRQHLIPGMGRLMSTQPPLGQGQGNSVKPAGLDSINHRPSRSHVAVSQRGSWYLSSSGRESVSGVTDHSWPCCSLFLSPASRCNVSLKKQRSRGILSSFFCCFRDYNVEAPPGSGPGVLPQLVEENGGLQKVSTNAPLPPRGLCPIPDEHP